jgi:pimeloyl-ACP methyl ester carboxylesterase
MKLIERDILANGIRLHVYRTETGKRPLVFANGLCFVPIAEQLADDFEIILYDSRGHGRSEAPQIKTTIIDRAEDLAGLLKVLGLRKPNLLGHSMGAATVAIYAGLYPGGPSRIVLEDPPPFEMLVPVDPQALEARKAWHKLAAANRQKSIPELVEMNRQESPTWPEAERAPWARSKQQFSLTVFEDGFIDPGLGKQIMYRITCPVLLLTADPKLGALYPVQAAEELVASLPAAWHVNIPGAGYSIRREQPEAYLKAVRSFLIEAA